MLTRRSFMQRVAALVAAVAAVPIAPAEAAPVAGPCLHYMRIASKDENVMDECLRLFNRLVTLRDGREAMIRSIKVVITEQGWRLDAYLFIPPDGGWIVMQNSAGEKVLRVRTHKNIGRASIIFRNWRPA